MDSFPFKREDDESSRMSDLESDYNGNRRLSTTSSPSSYKMSIDSDDGRSISSISGKSSIRGSDNNVDNTSASRIARPPLSNWTTSSNNNNNNNIRTGGEEEETMITTVDSCIFDYNRQPKKTHHQQQQQQQQQKSYDFRERRDPERRNVNRRSSLLPKSKALLRVIDQAEEDTHLADIEMRREHETTAQLHKLDDSAKLLQQDVPAASWTKVTDTTMPLYQCSKLNPEIEMTNFQLENISSTNQYKSIKRKASEDRLEPYPTSMSLKRRAVSPSVSLNGSPVLSAMSSPPTNFLLLYGTSTSNNAAAKTQQKPGFNLHDASGGLSRMSLSE